jgi:DNA-binding transcriptional ArsR family regulator
MGRLFEAKDGRLPGPLAATLKPEFHDALDHPIRRDVLRALNRSSQPQGIGQLSAKLRAVRPAELSYHLQVLRRSGAIDTSGSSDPGHDHYVSELDRDRRVGAILRATEQQDREGREAAASGNASSLLTMFRVPRPSRTIRLRGRSKIDSKQDR